MTVLARRDASPGQTGFLYLEVILATILVAVALVPAIDALRTGIDASAIDAASPSPNQPLYAKAEEVLGRPYAVLDFAANRAASSATVAVSSPRDAANPGLDPGPGYSDTNFLVYIFRFDGTAATSTDTGLLRVKVVDRSNPAAYVDVLAAR